MEKKILYIHRKDVDKVNKVRGVAIIRKIRLLSAPEEEILSLPEDAELLKFIGFSPKEVEDFFLFKIVLLRRLFLVLLLLSSCGHIPVLFLQLLIQLQKTPIPIMLRFHTF